MQRSLARAAALSPQLCSMCGRALPCRPRGAWGLTILLQKREQGTRRAAQKLSQQARRHLFSSTCCFLNVIVSELQLLCLQEAAAGEWAALAQGVPDEEDSELMSSINEACRSQRLCNWALYCTALLRPVQM